MSAMVTASTPGAPWLARTSNHARRRTSLRRTRSYRAWKPSVSATAWPPSTACVAGPESYQGCCWASRPCTDSSLVVQAQTKQGRFASGRVVLSSTLIATYHPLRRPPGSMRLPVRRLYAPAAPEPQGRGRGGPLQFPSPPSARSTSLTPEGSSALHFQALHAFHGLRLATPGSAPSCPLAGLG